PWRGPSWLNVQARARFHNKSFPNVSKTEAPLFRRRHPLALIVWRSRGRNRGGTGKSGMRLAAILAIMLLVSACTSTGYDFADLMPEPSSAMPPPERVAVLHPRFDDRRPHPWDGRAPWSYPVHGTDVSRYQSGLDWNEA